MERFEVYFYGTENENLSPASVEMQFEEMERTTRLEPLPEWANA